MRTTLDLSDEVLRAAEQWAAENGVSLREVVESALLQYLSGKGPRGGYRIRWRTENGRLQPGVNLDDRGALFDIMC